MRLKLLYVTAKPHRAGVDIAIYDDGVPAYAPRKVYARHLDGSEGSTLEEIVGWYLVHAEYGSLPPDNTIPPPAPKEKKSLGFGHREKPWSVGDMTIEPDSREVEPRARRERRETPPVWSK